MEERVTREGAKGNKKKKKKKKEGKKYGDSRADSEGGLLSLKSPRESKPGRVIRRPTDKPFRIAFRSTPYSSDAYAEKSWGIRFRRPGDSVRISPAGSSNDPPTPLE